MQPMGSLPISLHSSSSSQVGGSRIHKLIADRPARTGFELEK